MDFFKGISIKQITDNTLAQILVRSTTAFATFTAIFLITYFQGFALLGSLTKIMAFISFFYLLVDFGFNAMYIKYYYQYTEKFLGNLVYLRLFLGITLAVLAILISSFLPYNPSTDSGYSWEEKIGIALYSLTIITTGISLSLSSILQKNLTYRLSLLPAIFSGCILISVIFLGAKTDNLFIVLTGYVLSQIIYITLLYKKLKAKYKISKVPTEFKQFSYFLLKVSIPLAIVLFFSLVLSKADMFLLSLLKSNFEVGVYAFAYKIFDFLIIIPAFLSASMYPILLQKQNTSQFMHTFKKYGILLFLSSLILTVITFTCAPLLKYLRGDFSLSVAPLQILALSLPFFFLTSLLQWMLIIKGRLIALAVIYAAVMIVSIILNLAYIPTFSYFATSVITVIAEGLVFLLMVIYLLLQKTKIFQKEA